MIRALLLKRQPLGGIASLAEALAGELPNHGVHADIEEASGWIPNETDIRSCKEPSKRLKKIGLQYDLVHAFGYRAAWACSDAYREREAWVYTAYDEPKTTHRLLIDKLNDAQLGFCSSYHVRDVLSEAGASDLFVRFCGVRPGFSSDTVEAAKQEGPSVIGALGNLAPQHGFDALISAMEQVWAQLPEATLRLAGEGGQREELEERAKASSKPGQVELLGHVESAAQFLAGCDLTVVPSRKAGFSMVAAESMALGLPVLLRAVGGLPEMVQDQHTGFLFETDEELGIRIAEILQMPITMSAVGNSAKLRASVVFSIASMAEASASRYRAILE